MLGNTVKMLFAFGGPRLAQGFWLKAQCLCQIRRAHLLHDDHGDGINCISSFSLKRLLWNQNYFENVIREVEKKTLTLWEEDNKGLAASGGFSAHQGYNLTFSQSKKRHGKVICIRIHGSIIFILWLGSFLENEQSLKWVTTLSVKIFPPQEGILFRIGKKTN